MVIISPFIYRTAYLVTAVDATNNIYNQQYQMGLFLQKYYKGEWVAINDAGATNYFGDIKPLDIWGLCNKEIPDAKLKGTLDNDTIDKLAKEKGCKIAVINLDTELIPTSWIKVGQWRLTQANVASVSDTVTFYAVEEDESSHLIHNLEDFSKYLPESIEESGNYTE